MNRLRAFETPPSIRLSLLWAALMGLYIYNDYYSMYLPGTIADMSSGMLGPLGKATATVMVAVSLLLAIPAMMIYFSAAMGPGLSKWFNIVLGVLYTIIEALTFPGSALFYQVVVAIEVLVTLLIVWTAWRWPKAE